MSLKKSFSYIVILLVWACAFFVEPAYRAILLMLLLVGLLVTEALPVITSTVLVLCMLPLTGTVSAIPEIFSGFSNPVIFFMIASFGIAAAFTKVPLTKRILYGMLKICGDSSEKVLLAIMICECLVSSVMSDVPSCLIFLAIGKQFLELYSDEAEKKRTGKIVMIGVTYASMIGGMLTPVGSSINILALNILEKYNGETVSFLQWMGISVPVVLLILPMAWFVLIKIYKPGAIDAEAKKIFCDNLGVEKKISVQEKKVIVIMIGMILLWVLSSWICKINIILVALCGAVLFQMPGIEVIDSKEFLKSIKWEAIFLVATVMSLGNLIVGAVPAETLLNLIYMPTHMPGAVLIVAIMVFVGLVFLPVAPSLVTIVSPLIFAVALSGGFSVRALVIVCAMCAGNCYLFPLDTVCLMTYSEGYYRIRDMFKISVLIQAWIVFVMTIFVPIFGRAVGLI